VSTANEISLATLLIVETQDRIRQSRDQLLELTTDLDPRFKTATESIEFDEAMLERLKLELELEQLKNKAAKDRND
jgi:hypothetical protein